MQKIKLAFLITLLPLALVSSTAFAAGYGSAGCGLGSMVIGGGQGPNQVFAATTNGTSGSQTFGISSGTSNCQPGQTAKLEREKEHFVKSNYPSLMKEMARGKGENLDILASYHGCSETSYKRFGNVIKRNFGAIVKNDNSSSSEILDAVKSRVEADDVLSENCVSAMR